MHATLSLSQKSSVVALLAVLEAESCIATESSSRNTICTADSWGTVLLRCVDSLGRPHDGFPSLSPCLLPQKHLVCGHVCMCVCVHWYTVHCMCVDVHVWSLEATSAFVSHWSGPHQVEASQAAGEFPCLLPRYSRNHLDWLKNKQTNQPKPKPWVLEIQCRSLCLRGK